MTLNPSSEAQRTTDVLNGAVSEYYEMIDSGLEPSEVRPGCYNTILSPSYQSPCPVKTGSYTTVDIGTVDPNTVLIEKSYIRCKVRAKIKTSFKLSGTTGVPTTNPQVIFFGHGESVEANHKYEILYNGKTLVDQSFCGEESFVTRSTKRDEVRDRKPNESTTWKNASSMSENVCGTHVLFDGTNAGAFFEIEYWIKIPLTSFPIFRDFKYLPGWMGNWSIRIWPHWQNMVCAQVHPDFTIGRKKVDAIANKGLNEFDFSTEFVQIGDEIRCITDYTAGQTTVGPVRFTVQEYEYSECMVSLTSQSMYYNVYESIKHKYMAKPLSIPYLSFKHSRFSGNLLNAGPQNFLFTGMVRCCECMFLIPFTTYSHHTVCKNPKFKGLYMNISGFGNYPQNPIDTVAGEEGSAGYIDFLNMTLDSLNIDNSPLVGMNSDLNNSLRGLSKYIRVIPAGGGGIAKHEIGVNEDGTNFLIGFPFADDADFQGGLTSQGNIHIKLNASMANYPGDAAPDIQPTGIFVCDQVVMIHPVADGPTQVAIVEDKLY